MKFIWQIEDNDIQRVKDFYNKHKNNHFVLRCIKRNVEKNIPDFSKEIFWNAMISCLLTTQQRSGPNSSVTKFIRLNPFPLDYSRCKTKDNLQKFTEKTITDFGGLRRDKNIGKEVDNNIQWLEGGAWNDIKEIFSELKNNGNKRDERKWAKFLIHKNSKNTKTKRLKGFGPKQSRNLLQSLGLTKYEIPLDSRITKWLHKFGFPITLSSGALADRDYFNFILDALQKLCEESSIYPCVLDAAIFQVLIGNGQRIDYYGKNGRTFI
jgi:hypothetical protein